MTDELAGVLEQLVVGSVAITARALASANAELTFMQWRVLVVVGEKDKGAAVGEIAARLGAHASPASRVVSRLRHRGLVQTDRSDQDKRVVCVRLTDAGREMRARVLQHRRRDIDDILQVLTLTQPETDVLTRLARSFEPFA
jgi:DNA-binding MarR family transcriptional regulator